MSCGRTRKMLDAWIDHELDTHTAAELDAHCRDCASCAALLEARHRTRDAIRALAPRFSAPHALKERVRERLSATLETRAREPRSAPAWAMALAGAAFGALAMFAVLHLPVREDARRLVVANHTAALASGYGLQVVSGDRHTIKPWFQGKVDFAPPVRELAQEGFTLLGARLDHVGPRPAAAIVYRIRNHPVELYVWPSERNEASALRVSTYRGFGVATWQGDGLAFAAVSDVDVRDLERFARLVRGGS